MIKRLIFILAMSASCNAFSNDLDDVNDLLLEKFKLNADEFAYLLINSGISISGDKEHLEDSYEGFPPWQVDSLEKKGYLYLLSYDVGDTGVGFKVYPTPKAYKILISTKTGTPWNPEDVHRNLESARNSGNYTYVSEQQ